MSKTWTSGTQTQSITFDVAPYLRASSIESLKKNDSLKIVMHLRATTALPATGADLYAQMQPVTIIGNSTHECSPLIDKIRIWDSDWETRNNRFMAGAGGTWQGISNFYHNASNNAPVLDLVIPWSQGQAVDVWTGDEYRPNGDNFSAVKVRYPNLLDIKSVNMKVNGIKGNMSTRTLNPGEYNVSYLNGETHVTINNGVTKDYMSSTSTTGLGYYITFDMINPTANNGTGYMPNYFNSFSFLNYPTSAAPQQVNLSNNAGSTVANGGMTNYPYKYAITAISPNVAPKSSRAEWTVRITNQSAFYTSDSKLPHSWVAVECPAGVVPQELRNASTGQAVSAPFVPYASGEVNKYWIKIGEITANPTADYILSCTYSICTGTPQLTLKYGMSKVAHPADPDNGYSNYNSTGILAGVVSTNISYTPPEIKFAGNLSHRANAANNTNLFCDTVRFEGEYSNGLGTNVGRLQLRVIMPPGASYFSEYPPEVKFGNSDWATVKSVGQPTPGYLFINLYESN
jgi:hypothetical protein